MCLLKIFRNLNISDLKSLLLIVNHNHIIINFISFITDLSSVNFFYTSFKKANFLLFLKINVLQEFFYLMKIYEHI